MLQKKTTQIRLWVSTKKFFDKFKEKRESQQEMMERVANILKKHGGKI